MDITNIIEKIKRTIDTHNLGEEGAYARFLRQNKNNDRKMGINEYGCADAANILYTINEFIREPEKREKWIEKLRSFQNKETGIFEEPTHHFIHTTAHCIAALELFDAYPEYPVTALEKYNRKEELYGLLDNLDWENFPWPQSHQGAGIYAVMTLTGAADAEWRKWYFDWLWENADPKTGFWKKGIEKKAPLYTYMGGGFHYFFNLENGKMPVRYPEKIIDSCIEMYENNEICSRFGKMIGFLEVDWAYCINRASRQTEYKFRECKEILRKFSKGFIEYLNDVNEKEDDEFNDLHMLFGAVCALAELQTALPGEILSPKPLRLVLDRRPFI